MEDLFRSALGQENGLTLRTLDKYGHHAPREVEGDFVELFVLLNQGLLVEIRNYSISRYQGGSSACLKMADQ